jgi:hypothetical protein
MAMRRSRRHTGGVLTGAHAIVYSRNADADRAFFRDVLELPHADAGEGWLIFGLPPSEIAVHPSDENGPHAVYLLCDDIRAFVASMAARGVACGPVLDRGWGLLADVTLPGGGSIGVYEPRHPRPASPAARKGARRTPSRPRARTRRARGTRRRRRTIKDERTKDKRTKD